MDIEEEIYEGVEWINLDQNKDQRQDFVGTVFT
jgi:hypothetical protein